MPKIEIRELKDEKIAIERKINQYCEYPTPGRIVYDESSIPYNKDDYVVALFKDDKPQSTAISIPLTQNVRGKIFSCSGVAMVGSYPEARRKGYVKRLMINLFEKMKADEQVFSLLYPFKEHFYERLGYVTFPQVRTLTFPITAISSLAKKEFEETIERVLLKDGFDEYVSVLRDLQKDIHGLSIKPPGGLDHIRDKLNLWLAIVRRDGKAIGFMTYKITEFFGTFKVRDFYYGDSSAKYFLLKWIALHQDQTKDAEIQLKPYEQPECWFVDMEANVKSRAWVPSPMGRISIVEKISGMNVGTGSFSAKVVDNDCPWNNDTFSFASEDGNLVVKKVEKYDCELTIQGLSALVYGGYDVGDFKFRGWGNPSIAIQEKMKKLFPPIVPHIHSAF